MVESQLPQQRVEVFPLRETGERRVLQQLDSFLITRRAVLEAHNPRQEREDRFLKGTFIEMIAERNKRADDLDSPEIQESIGIVKRVMPFPTYSILCMDGRVTSTHMFGFPIGTTGGSIRLPAGDPQEFVPAREGGVMLRPKSYAANALDRAVEGGIEIVEVLDSHVGCAARNRIEESKSQDRGDNGLLQDVKRKKKIAKALQDRSENITPIQTSFDPHTGHLYMGLENDTVLARAEKNGFTPELLENLVERDDIIYTGNLASDPQIRVLFEQNKIERFDWENNHRDTTVSFWRNMENMVSTNNLAGYIRETYVRRLFPDAEEKELQERSMLLASNAYNVFHMNTEGEYPFADHKESCIVISEGESGPLGRSPSFSLFSDATTMYDEYLRLADGLIRGNRKAERVTDHTGLYQNDEIEDFARAPIPVLHQTLVRDGEVNWDDVRGIVSQNGAIPEAWYKMSSDQFQKHLVQRGISMPLSVYNALDTLRQEMSAIYKPEGNTDESLFDGSLEIVPALVDSRRRVQAIVPFIHWGHVPNENN